MNGDRRRRFGVLNLLRRCGSSASLAPGKLAASGHRVPAATTPGGYASVTWLCGGVMAYSMQVLSDECFSEDLFAMYERRVGKGEDTHLSSRVAAKGHLLLSGYPAFHHPDTSSPVAYPTAPCKLGFSRAYSRRLLNDNYRWPESTTFADRLALVKSYCGTLLLNWFRALVSPQMDRFAYAWGYTCGAWTGLSQPPTAQRLTPIVNWATDAQAAQNATRIIVG